MRKSLIPIAFPGKGALNEGTRILAADVGGTKTHLALFAVEQGELLLISEAVFASKEWNSLTEVLRGFDLEPSDLPEVLSIAFAGPIQDGKARATNLNWSVNCRKLREELGVSRVLLLNDLEAEAYGLAGLRESDLRVIYSGPAAAKGNAAVIAPGTGLGEAGLFWDGDAFRPFATEGGHADFAPRTEQDWELLRYLQEEYGHVSWERVVSGPGIHTIFRFLSQAGGWKEPNWLKEKLAHLEPAAAIGLGAKKGLAVCEETLRLFVRYLAVEASNLALKLKATGGLFIGGGVTPRIWNEGLQAVFLEHFFDVGRLRPLLEKVPVHLVLNPKTALLGAALYGASLSRENQPGNPAKAPSAKVPG